MATFILIESRDPFEHRDADEYYYNLADNLTTEGHKVTVFLVQNGVLPARRGPRGARLGELAARGVEVLADDFSLRERGIPAGSLVPGVAAASIDRLVDLIAEPSARALWH